MVIGSALWNFSLTIDGPSPSIWIGMIVLSSGRSEVLTPDPTWGAGREARGAEAS